MSTAPIKIVLRADATTFERSLRSAKWHFDALAFQKWRKRHEG